MSDKLSRAAAARFFIRAEQAGLRWEDRNTLPLFPLLLVIDEEMMDADAKWEASKTGSTG
jgi:uncharacterized protein (DUF952 family)